MKHSIRYALLLLLLFLIYEVSYCQNERKECSYKKYLSALDHVRSDTVGIKTVLRSLGQSALKTPELCIHRYIGNYFFKFDYPIAIHIISGIDTNTSSSEIERQFRAEFMKRKDQFRIVDTLPEMLSVASPDCMIKLTIDNIDEKIIIITMCGKRIIKSVGYQRIYYFQIKENMAEFLSMSERYRD